MAKRRWIRTALGLGLLTGTAYALWRAIEANRVGHGHEWEPQPFPFPPQPRTTPREGAGEPAPASPLEPEPVAACAPPLEPEPVAAWVEPTADGCPPSHPVKAKLSSRIFHVPGGLSYDRTVADRCYVDRAAAEAEGFRAAKR